MFLCGEYNWYMPKNALVVTDLDGTLLNSQGELSLRDRCSLLELAKRGIYCVVATGRSPYSFDKVAAGDFPIDYLIFSSGAGVINWQTKELLLDSEISAPEAQRAVDILVGEGVDFMVHEPIPANHRFLFFDSGNGNPDFHRRISIYRQHCRPLAVGVGLQSPITQLVAVLPPDVDRFHALKEKLAGFKVVRATSPLDGTSIWMEIFHPSVSKANATLWLCRRLGVGIGSVVAVGNDYNDLDLLGTFGKSYVVANAPAELRDAYRVVDSNNLSGFSQAMQFAGLLP